jgi:tRNA(Ile)-lysidine synthase
METLQTVVRTFCTEHALFKPGRVVVAVSGGADSLALLHLLNAIRETFGIVLHVATYDHGLRGTAGAEDAAYVRETAEKWGLPVTVGGGDVPTLAAEWRLGLEAAARRARYAFLIETARAVNAETVATGHHQDDQAETVLLHVLRGAGLAGLRGMLPVTQLGEVRLVRPLLAVARAELTAYLAAAGLTPRHDATNDDLTYTRNRLRHQVMPLLRGINPDVSSALARLAETAREDYAALLATLPPVAPPRLPRPDFLAMKPAVQRLWLRCAAAELRPGIELSFERTSAAIRFAEGLTGPGVVQLGGGVNFRATHKLIWLEMEGEN